MDRPKNGALKAVLWIAAIAVLLGLAKYFGAQEFLGKCLIWIRGLGPWGPPAFIAVYAAATLAFVPGSLLTLGAGLLYGVLWGTVCVSIASTLGATAAFLAGRFLARNWVARMMAADARFKAIDEAVGREGWKIVLLTRLSPVFPFNLLNYAFGLTRVSLKHYFFASWIGMLPGTVMYVYIGSLAGDLAHLGAGGRRGPAQWALYLAGLIATAAVTLYVTRLARRALEKTL